MRMRSILLTAAAASLALIPIAREIFGARMADNGESLLGRAAASPVSTGFVCGVVSR